jgi:hypothetical protein
MNYVNCVIDESFGQAVPILAKIKHNTRKVIARIKWHLRENGWPVKFTYDDAKADGRFQPKLEAWGWSADNPPPPDILQELLDEAIMPWLDDVVLRSPVPLGLDSSSIVIKVVANDKKVAEHWRVVCKYGWRKAGREETERWIFDELNKHRHLNGRIDIGVLSMGRFLIAYDLAKPNGKFFRTKE